MYIRNYIDHICLSCVPHYFDIQVPRIFESYTYGMVFTSAQPWSNSASTEVSGERGGLWVALTPLPLVLVGVYFSCGQVLSRSGVYASFGKW